MIIFGTVKAQTGWPYLDTMRSDVDSLKLIMNAYNYDSAQITGLIQSLSELSDRISRLEGISIETQPEEPNETVYYDTLYFNAIYYNGVFHGYYSVQIYGDLEVTSDTTITISGSTPYTKIENGIKISNSVKTKVYLRIRGATWINVKHKGFRSYYVFNVSPFQSDLPPIVPIETEVEQDTTNTQTNDIDTTYSVIVRWNENEPSDNVYKYRIYWTFEGLQYTDVYEGNQVYISDLKAGDYCFNVTAFNWFGESGLSLGAYIKLGE